MAGTRGAIGTSSSRTPRSTRRSAVVAVAILVIENHGKASSIRIGSRETTSASPVAHRPRTPSAPTTITTIPGTVAPTAFRTARSRSTSAINRSSLPRFSQRIEPAAWLVSGGSSSQSGAIALPSAAAPCRHRNGRQAGALRLLAALCEGAASNSRSYAGDMTRPFVPDDFVVPQGLTGPGFRLEPLGPQHNDADHRAWMTSIEHIRATPGFSNWRWPPTDGLSLHENLR